MSAPPVSRVIGLYSKTKEILDTRNESRILCVKRVNLKTLTTGILAITGDRQIIDLFVIYSEKQFKMGREEGKNRVKSKADSPFRSVLVEQKENLYSAILHFENDYFILGRPEL
jgi:hypothetical protein